MSDEVTVWRASTALRMCCFGFFALIGLFVTMMVINAGPAALVIAPFFTGLAVMMWWGVLRPRTSAGPHGLTILRSRHPVDVAWADIRSCRLAPITTSRQFGPPAAVLIECTDGRLVASAWPQKSNLARWMRRETEADRILTYIRRRADWERNKKGPMPRYMPA